MSHVLKKERNVNVTWLAILSTLVSSHPVGPGFQLLACSFLLFHILCAWASRAMVRQDEQACQRLCCSPVIGIHSTWAGYSSRQKLWITVNLLIFAAINFRFSLMESHFAEKKFTFAFHLITYKGRTKFSWRFIFVKSSASQIPKNKLLTKINRFTVTLLFPGFWIKVWTECAYQSSTVKCVTWNMKHLLHTRTGFWCPYWGRGTELAEHRPQNIWNDKSTYM